MRQTEPVLNALLDPGQQSLKLASPPSSACVSRLILVHFRKQHPDRGTRVLPGGLYLPAPRALAAELQGLCTDGPKGNYQ